MIIDKADDKVQPTNGVCAHTPTKNFGDRRTIVSNTPTTTTMTVSYGGKFEHHHLKADKYTTMMAYQI